MLLDHSGLNEVRRPLLHIQLHLQEGEWSAEDLIQPRLRPSLAFRVEAKDVAQTAIELLVVPHREHNLGLRVEMKELTPKEVKGVVDPCRIVLQEFAMGGWSQVVGGDRSTPQRKMFSLGMKSTWFYMPGLSPSLRQEPLRGNRGLLEALQVLPLKVLVKIKTLVIDPSVLVPC